MGSGAAVWAFGGMGGVATVWGAELRYGRKRGLGGGATVWAAKLRYGGFARYEPSAVWVALPRYGGRPDVG